MANKLEKRAAAKEAVELVKDGMTLGIGTGSTAAEFIPFLIRRVENEHLNLKCICTSQRSQQSLKGRIPLIDEILDQPIDLTFDGADRVDTTTFQLIKGGGGALLREKIVALNSNKNIVLTDHTKIDTRLEGYPLAIEVVPFGIQTTIGRLQILGYKGSLRTDDQSNPIRSDNKNFIFDIHFAGPILNPPEHHMKIKQVLGVIETGLFLTTASVIYVGNKDGTVTILEKPC